MRTAGPVGAPNIRSVLAAIGARTPSPSPEKEEEEENGITDDKDDDDDEPDEKRDEFEE